MNRIYFFLSMPETVQNEDSPAATPEVLETVQNEDPPAVTSEVPETVQNEDPPTATSEVPETVQNEDPSIATSEVPEPAQNKDSSIAASDLPGTMSDTAGPSSVECHATENKDVPSNVSPNAAVPDVPSTEKNPVEVASETTSGTVAEEPKVQRIGFTLDIIDGKLDEYIEHHNKSRPEVVEALRSVGIRNLR